MRSSSGRRDSSSSARGKPPQDLFSRASRIPWLSGNPQQGVTLNRIGADSVRSVVQYDLYDFAGDCAAPTIGALERTRAAATRHATDLTHMERSSHPGPVTRCGPDGLRCDQVYLALPNAHSGPFQRPPIPIGAEGGRGDAQRLAACSLTANERDVPPRHAEARSKERDERVVRPAFDRRRGKPDLQAVAVDTRDLGFFRARLGVNLERDRAVGADAPPRNISGRAGQRSAQARPPAASARAARARSR